MRIYTYLKCRRLFVYFSSLVLLLNSSQLQAESLQPWLRELVDNHPSVLSVASDLEAAKFKRVAADKAIYNPEFEFDSESVEDVNTSTVGLSQTIDWGDKRGANTHLAQSNLLISHYTFLATRRAVAHQALVSLGNFHTTKALKELANQRQQLMRRFETLTIQRFNYGDLAQVDVDLAKLSYVQARFHWTGVGLDEVRTKQNLITTSGRTKNVWPSMPSFFPDPTMDKADVEDIIQSMPEMLKSTAMVKSAQANIKVQLTQAVANPTVKLRAGREEADHLLALTFSMPLQIRNNFQAEVNVANAGMIRAERDAIGVYRMLTGQLEIAAVSYALNREAWMFWEQTGASTLDQQIILLERLWKAGELSTTEYLLQLTQTLETKASAIEQRGKLWRSWAEWLLTTGKIKHWLAVKSRSIK